jgi:hypothetical protein
LLPAFSLVYLFLPGEFLACVFSNKNVNFTWQSNFVFKSVQLLSVFYLNLEKKYNFAQNCLKKPDVFGREFF